MQNKNRAQIFAVVGLTVVIGLGLFYYQNEKKKKKVDTVKKVTDVEPSMDIPVTPVDNAEGAKRLKTKGNKCYSEGRYEKAIEYYSRAIELHPDAVFYCNRAASYAKLENHEAAAADCTFAISMDEIYIKAFMRRGQSHEKLNKQREALVDYTAVCIMEKFENKMALAATERILQEIANVEIALRQSQKNTNLPSKTFVSAYFASFGEVNEFPDEEPAQLKEGNGDEFYEYALKLLRSKQYNESFEATKKAVDIGTSNEASAYELLGTFRFLIGDLNEAEKCLETSVMKGNAHAKIKLANLFMERANVEKALELMNECIENYSSNAKVFYHRGQIKFLINDFEGALKDYEESLKLDDTFQLAHIQQGVAQYKLGKVKVANATFKRAIKQFPTSADIHNYFGELLVDQKKVEEAIEEFDEAIRLSPKNPLAYLNKALSIYQFKFDVDGAELLARQAVEADPSWDIGLTQLAQILLQRAKVDEAMKTFDRAIELARTETDLKMAASSARTIVITKYAKIAEIQKTLGFQ